MNQPDRKPIVEIQGVSRQFGEVTALNQVSLDIQAGEFFSLLGPSGCGKTTLLRMIAGFETPDSGRICLDSADMAGVSPDRRPTNMVFQSYAIFPHMNVARNVGYGLARSGLNKQDIAARVKAALELVSLGGYGERAPHALSGGQRQRVALARALVMEPKVLLLDEPLSALDKKLREQMQRELRRLQQTVGITFVLVTHDQEEALTMSDRIAVMFGGQIAQVDTPMGLYQRPVNRQVAGFIGAMNFLNATILDSSSTGVSLEIEALGRIELPVSGRGHNARTGPVTVGIRPEMLTVLYGQAVQAERVFTADVISVAYYGDMTSYDLRITGSGVTVAVSMRNTAGRPVLAVGTTTRVGWAAESVVLLD